MAAFLADVRETVLSSTGATRSAQTLRLYLNAASVSLHLLTGKCCDMSNPAKRHTATPGLHPILYDLIDQQKKWEKPRNRYQPLTIPIIQQLAKLAINSPHSSWSAPAVIYDVVVLGIFTGSRVSEYGQTSLTGNRMFNTVPCNTATQAQGGLPLAFMRSDFVFLDNNQCVVDHSLVWSTFHQKGLSAVRVQFRYDKGNGNFKHRMFTCTRDPLICPVRAAASLINRSFELNVPSTHPVAVHVPFKKSALGYSFLRDYTVRNLLQKVCLQAYPDKNHILHREVSSITCHSLRVTAAVCLMLAGEDIPTIAYKLRWEPSSVPTYLRDCYQDVGTTLQSAIKGAYQLT